MDMGLRLPGVSRRKLVPHPASAGCRIRSRRLSAWLHNSDVGLYAAARGLFFGYLYQGSASANVDFPIGRNTVAGASYNFLFDIAQVAWVTDVKVLGGSLGFAALLPFGSERTSASLSFTGPFDVNRQLGRTASVDALGEPVQVRKGRHLPCAAEARVHRFDNGE